MQQQLSVTQRGLLRLLQEVARSGFAQDGIERIGHWIILDVEGSDTGMHRLRTLEALQEKGHIKELNQLVPYGPKWGCQVVTGACRKCGAVN